MSSGGRPTRHRSSSGAIVYPPVEAHLLPSSYVAQRFKIEVMLPPRRKGDRRRAPVLYVTDGNRVFDAFKGISHLLQRGDGQCDFILVAIGYPGNSPLAGAVLRARDFTCENYIRHSVEPPPIEGVLEASPGTKDFYGADEFLSFIEYELVPFIDRTYRSIRGHRSYFGHSQGGSLGLHALFSRTHLFKNYIISSPGLSYHGQSTAGIVYDNYDFMFDNARKFFDSQPHVDSVRLHLSVGSEEEFDEAVSNWRLTSSFYRFRALLEHHRIPGLTVTSEVLTGEDHLTAWPVAFLHGIRAIYGRDPS